MVCSCVVRSKRVLLQIIFCSCVIGTTFSREKWQITSLSCQKVIKIWKQSWWSNDKTIIELGYHKISWFVSVSQINYLPKPKAEANNSTARHWQITIFCSTSSILVVNYNIALAKRAFWLANKLDRFARGLHTHVSLFIGTFSRQSCRQS